MTNFPFSQFPLLGAGVKNNVVTANEILAWLDCVAAGANIKSATGTPPGSPANGDLHLLAGSITGVWNSDGAVAGQFAFYFNGWLYITPSHGMRAFDATTREQHGYDSTYGWYPLQDRWSTTEHFTGKFRGTPGALTRVFSKVVQVSGLPNNTTKNTAHGISNLNLDSGVVIQAAIGKSSATKEAFALPARAGVGTSLCAARIVAADLITDTTGGFNGSAYDGDFRLEFLKTA